MENSISHMTSKDGFEISFNKTDTELNIKAENKQNGNIFSTKLTNDTIKTMSLELFENIPELFEGLLASLKGISEDPSIRVDPSGTIFFTQKLNIGKHEKILKFPIP